MVADTISSDGVFDGVGNGLELDFSAIEGLLKDSKGALKDILDVLSVVLIIAVVVLVLYVLKSYLIPFFKWLWGAIEFIFNDVLIPFLLFPFKAVAWIFGWLFGK